MLLQFEFKNFRSFQTEQQFSMLASPLKQHSETLFHSPGIAEPILTAAAVYGANASGKTNLLHALQFMAKAVKSSHSRWEPDEHIPREAFASGAEQGQPSMFTVNLLVEKVRYQYGFTVSDTAVLEEWLFAYPKGKRQAWFNRRAGRPISFSEKMQGENRTIEALMRPNSLFLSTAAQNNHPMLSPVYKWFSQSLKFVLGDRTQWKRRSARLCTDSRYRDAIVRMVGFADLGIADLTVTEQVIPEVEKRVITALVAALKREVTEIKDEQLHDLLENQKQVHLLHRLGDQLIPFEPEQESNGTIAYLTLLVPIISVLGSGGVVCVDELDASLHPLLAMQLIHLFSNLQENPKGAQLIFNTHDTNLLSRGILRRDQIWFAEKKQDGSSQIYPLTDFKPRNEENLVNGYLQGRYGAIPFLNPESCFSGEVIEHDEA